MTGPGRDPAPRNPVPLTLNNAKAAQELLRFLGIVDKQVRFGIIDQVVPVAIVAEPQADSRPFVAWGTATVAAVVAENAHLQIFNPAGSGVIIHVDTAILISTAATSISIREHDQAITTNIATLGWRDRRLPGAPTAQTRVQSNATLIGSAVNRTATPGFDDPILTPVDAFLGEDQGLIFANEIQNRNLTMGLYWEEIPN